MADIGMGSAFRNTELIGKTGCSRSRACIWLFSSTLSTSARLGGDK